MTHPNVSHDLYGQPIDYRRTTDVALVWNALRRAVRAIGSLFRARPAA